MNRRARFAGQDKQEWKLIDLEMMSSGWRLWLAPAVDDGADWELLLQERHASRTMSLPLMRSDGERLGSGAAYVADIPFIPSGGHGEALFDVDTWDAYVRKGGVVAAGGEAPRWRVRSHLRERESLYAFHRPRRLAAIPYSTVQGNLSIRIRRVNGSAKLVSTAWDGDGVLVLNGYVFGPLVDPNEPKRVHLSLVVRNEAATAEYAFAAKPVPWIEEGDAMSTAAAESRAGREPIARVVDYAPPSAASSLAFTARIPMGALDLAGLMDQRLEFFVSVGQSDDERLLPLRQREGGPAALDRRNPIVHTHLGAVRCELLLDGMRPFVRLVPHDLEAEVEAVYARDGVIQILGRVLRPAGHSGAAQLCLRRRDSQAGMAVPVVVEDGRFNVRLTPSGLLRDGLRPGLWDLSLSAQGRACRLRSWQDGIAHKNQLVRFPCQRFTLDGQAYAVYPLYTRGDYLAVRVRPDVRVKSVLCVEARKTGLTLRVRLEVFPPVEGVDQVTGVLTVRCKYGKVLRIPVACSLQRVGQTSNFQAVLMTTLSAGEFAAIHDDVVRNLHFDSVECVLEFPSHQSRFPITLSPDAVVSSFDDRLDRRPRLRRVFDRLRVLFYRAANRVLPVRSDLIVFQSYYGNSYACNPRAIYEQMLRQGRRFRAVWVMKDLNKRLPGSPRLVKPRSTAYFYYMARAKYFINNGNFPDFYRKRRGTVHVETWHGTPLKRLGYDVDPGSTAYKENTAPELLSRVRRWDYLVAPNPYTAEILCRAYRYDKAVLEVGYPRNDVFYRPDAARRAQEIRRRLDIPETKRIILYAPTWRDSEHQGQQRHAPYEFRFDLDDFKREFGHDYVLLLRLHYFDAQRMQWIDDSGIVRNLTYYDDIADLYLISDLLITDYSSVMFDFANSGRPMIFFTYDLLAYRSVMRGFYFDLEEQAPGPLVRTEAELFAAIRQVDEWSIRYQDKYDAFRRRFCSLEDGGAARRVIEAVFDDVGKGGRR
ncbi:CDP-glycerol glycerophosphotransferase family protein [Alicyclobacillus shizuokensis]|uniref:CDP-glycerol glycerophosphotransferase family protein n=1 Tax=Alicyclobacillus shizuokensis TaxID=392014 RepID=UPI0008324AFB|nr:CDP-glycerol glycerophosphotransferase family protein [Alicyclobacillus shizuokensis]